MSVAQPQNHVLVANRYYVEKVIGQGAYGTVVSAVDHYSGQRVAVKKIGNVFQSYPSATRALRELKFLRMLGGHENIITVLDVLVPEVGDNCYDVYIVFEKFPADLGKILLSRTELRRDHIKFIMFQILSGIDFLHRAHVFHRDLKPSNILLNNKCHVRICDFGLARAALETDTLVFWTDYVATRWYRAPELILVHMTQYSTAIDMWSVGCIFGEILRRGQPMFPGQTIEEQFDLITRVTGTPSQAVIDNLRTPRAREVVSELPRREGIPLKLMCEDAEEEELDLLGRMLTFDPRERISAAEALSSPYFRDYQAHYAQNYVEAPTFAADDFLFERRQFNQQEMMHEFRSEASWFGASQGQDTSYTIPTGAARMREMTNAVEQGDGFRTVQTMPNQRGSDGVEREAKAESSILQELHR